MPAEDIAIEQETTEAIGENKHTLAERLNAIQRDADLSASAKARYAAEATREAEERHREIVQEHECSKAEALEQNEKRVFKIAYPKDVLTDARKESFRGAYRDATFRLLEVSDDALDRVMSRGLRTGDTALQQACYHEAIERGAHSVADEYRERYPKANEVWQTYAKTRRVAESREAILGSALLRSGGPGDGA
jgi:hypothetical protein